LYAFVEKKSWLKDTFTKPNKIRNSETNKRIKNQENTSHYFKQTPASKHIFPFFCFCNGRAHCDLVLQATTGRVGQGSE